MAIDFGEKKRPLRERVFDLLSDLEWHTHVELNRIGGNRYAARILELKRQGYRVDSRPLGEMGKEYRLLSLNPGVPQPKRVRVFLELEDARLVANCTDLPTRVRYAVQGAIESYLSRGDAL